MGFMNFLGKIIDGYYGKELNKYLERATQGDKDAQYQVGIMYSKGNGVEKNDEEAVKWYTMAAEQGHTLAINDLGQMYLSGLGVKRDETKAVQLFQEAAKTGEAMAQYNLGMCFEKGRGVKQDQKEAVMWYKKSAKRGNIQAQYRLKKMGDKERYGFTRKELVVEDVWSKGENSPEYKEYMLAVVSQRGYLSAAKQNRENSMREMDLENAMVEGLKKQDDLLEVDTLLNANANSGNYFQQCGDIYINPKFITVTNIGVHMIKTSDVFAVSYDLVRSNNPRKSKYLLVFYTYNKLLPCFATEIVVGLGTKQYDYFGIEGVEKYIPYLNLKYPIKPFLNMKYHLVKDKAFINLFKYPELESKLIPAIEFQRGMFDPSLFPRDTERHKEAISLHFERGYKPAKTIILGGDD